MRRQKDTDARWTIKRGRRKRSEASEMKAKGVEIAVPIFGYSEHPSLSGGQAKCVAMPASIVATA